MIKSVGNNFIENFKGYFTVATFIALMTFIVQQSRQQENVELRLQEVEKHTRSTDMHMPFSEKIKTFIPRMEIEGRLKTIENSQDKIEKKIDKILDKI
jgi:hypothetical protein